MELQHAQSVPTEYRKAEAEEASGRLQRLLFAEVLSPSLGSGSSSDSRASSDNRSSSDTRSSSDRRSNSDSGSSQLDPAIESARRSVRMFAMSSNFRAAENEQHRVVDGSSKLDVTTLERQAKAISAARTVTDDPSTQRLLDGQHKNLVRQLASPFVDRLVLAGLQLEQGKLGEAEKTLTNALNTQISPLANDKNMSELRKSAELKRNELTLSRLTPKFLEERFSSIDRNGNQYLRIDELRAARKNPLFTSEEHGMLDFLDQNYDMLRNSSNDEMLRETSGISMKDIESYRSRTRPFEFR